jgi:hypothetical protein
VLKTLYCSVFVENIALNKLTWQQTQFRLGHQQFHSSNAVDGLRSDLSIWGGQCAISNTHQRTATWNVDLGEIYTIRHITIFYRTDNVAFGLYPLLVLYFT